MNFLDNFPKNYQPRDDQKFIINSIEESVKSGFKNIIICAPTGIGKTYIASTIAKSCKSSIVLTAQKILQNQYTSDFNWISSIKGKSNFPCLALYDSKLMSYNDALQNKLLSCDNGKCSWMDIDESGSKKVCHCQFKPRLEDFSCVQKYTDDELILSPNESCYYYIQKYAGLLSSHTIFNYSSFFQTKKFDSGFENLLKRGCIIADEAHEIEDKIVDFVGFELFKNDFDEIQFTIPNSKIFEIEYLKEILNQLIEFYRSQIQKFEFDKESDVAYGYKNRLQKIEHLKSQLDLMPENFIVEEITSNSNVVGYSVKPLEVKDYINQFFDYPTQLFMSATINKKIFCDTMGFDNDKTDFIEIEHSPFPLENRRVHFLNVMSLSGNPNEEQLYPIYGKIDELLQKHSAQRGLILTSSKKSCDQIFKNVAEESSLRISLLYGNRDTDKEKILSEHAEQVNDVLLSPSLWYGINLRDELSRFQIIVKTPYPALNDKRTKAKSSINPLWYKFVTLTKLLQGFGRSIRSENDYAVTYVLDSAAIKLINDMKDYIPKSYLDVLGFT